MREGNFLHGIRQHYYDSRLLFDGNVHSCSRHYYQQHGLDYDSSCDYRVRTYTPEPTDQHGTTTISTVFYTTVTPAQSTSTIVQTITTTPHTVNSTAVITTSTGHANCISYRLVYPSSCCLSTYAQVRFSPLRRDFSANRRYAAMFRRVNTVTVGQGTTTTTTRLDTTTSTAPASTSTQIVTAYMTDPAIHSTVISTADTPLAAETDTLYFAGTPVL
ncbi:hypothetical protein C8R44DRAFT_207718 [Mycena epipterygia]|nr:hypothetical protein C8R44DRAFT_207718 [Mycena epipterygia]